MNTTLTSFVLTVFIGLVFALMSFFLFRMALLKERRIVLRAVPGALFALFSMAIIVFAIYRLPAETPPDERSDGWSRDIGSVSSPSVLGQVVLTQLPEFAFMDSKGDVVKLEPLIVEDDLAAEEDNSTKPDTMVVEDGSEEPDEQEKEKGKKKPTPARRLVPLDEENSRGPKVIPAGTSASHRAGP